MSAWYLKVGVFDRFKSEKILKYFVLHHQNDFMTKYTIPS